MNPFEKFAKLKELHKEDPESVQRIEDDQQRVSDLLKKQEFAALEVTQELLALCRKDILTARLKLASDRTLTDDTRAELWHIVDARDWFLRMVAKDYDSELEQIDRELETELLR